MKGMSLNQVRVRNRDIARYFQEKATQNVDPATVIEELAVTHNLSKSMVRKIVSKSRIRRPRKASNNPILAAIDAEIMMVTNRLSELKAARDLLKGL